MNSDGSGEREVAPAMSQFGIGIGAPDWSPDGKKFVFTEGNAIWTINADGSGRILLSEQHYAGPQEQDPAWSPDGTKIAFTTYRDGTAEIYTMNPDGSGQTNITRTPPKSIGSNTDPAWSPDGTKIVYLSGLQSALTTMNANGSGKRVLTANALYPAWQPCIEGLTKNCVAASPVRTPPRLSLTAPRKQRLGRKRRISLVVQCDAACSVTASASIQIGHASRRYKTKTLRKQLAAASAEAINLRFPMKAATAARHALAHRKRLTAILRVVAKNSGGRSTAKRKIKLVH
jgi:dipeptidyl aminopeptidase/acylaminoacyl peptidase